MNVQSAGRTRKRPIQDLLARAMEHHQKGELPQAEKYYKRALKAAPDHPDALHLAGLVAHQLGRQPRAIKLINKAIKKDYNKGLLHQSLAIHNHLSNWEDARAAASSAVKLDEADGEAWGNLGQALAGLGEIDEALSAMEVRLSWRLIIPNCCVIRQRCLCLKSSMNRRSGMSKHSHCNRACQRRCTHWAYSVDTR